MTKATDNLTRVAAAAAAGRIRQLRNGFDGRHAPKFLRHNGSLPGVDGDRRATPVTRAPRLGVLVQLLHSAIVMVAPSSREVHA